MIARVKIGKFSAKLSVRDGQIVVDGVEDAVARKLIEELAADAKREYRSPAQGHPLGFVASEVARILRGTWDMDEVQDHPGTIY